ncbi:MAG: LysR family transcriptional regulator [Micavibrio aeruginosavorus]|uniref:LysR family transcriptional regulator n=1 Tax=Micavibrio aeruginosavorus TaxID=349221 RepID=A0A2W5PJ15_9BACT|nr:MAG: LysR family transcriptional regulator [Micavibrio aeruginosavorus]
MDWDKLRIFYAVAEAGSFTHAGDTLNLSQSAVSRQISTLEESIGVTLFHRHARGLILTEEGELLHKTASEIFGKLAMIEGQLADSRQLPEGPLRITVAEFIGSTWLAPRLAQLRAEHPDIQLTMLHDDRILNLNMREADAAIRLYKPEQPDLIQRHLTSINFHICASKDYLKAKGTPKTVKDLKKHTLIGYPENGPAPFADPNWLFRVAEIHDEANADTIMMNSIYGIFETVKAGAGIAALPDYLIAKEDNIVKILPEAVRPPVEVYFVYPEERRNSKRIGIFKDFLLKTVSETKF